MRAFKRTTKTLEGVRELAASEVVGDVVIEGEEGAEGAFLAV